MNTKNKVLLAIASAALAVPAAGFAQSYNQQPAYDQQPGPPQGDQAPYGQPGPGMQGDMQPGSDQSPRHSKHNHSHAAGYPELQPIERQIHREIKQAEQSGALQADNARQLKRQLHHIKKEEQQEFAANGGNLPPADSARYHAELDQLARSVGGPGATPHG